MIAESPRELHFSVENTLLNQKNVMPQRHQSVRGHIDVSPGQHKIIPQIYPATNEKKYFSHVLIWDFVAIKMQAGQ